MLHLGCLNKSDKASNFTFRHFQVCSPSSYRFHSAGMCRQHALKFGWVTFSLSAIFFGSKRNSQDCLTNHAGRKNTPPPSPFPLPSVCVWTRGLCVSVCVCVDGWRQIGAHHGWDVTVYKVNLLYCASLHGRGGEPPPVGWLWEPIHLTQPPPVVGLWAPSLRRHPHPPLEMNGPAERCLTHIPPLCTPRLTPIVSLWIAVLLLLLLFLLVFRV